MDRACPCINRKDAIMVFFRPCLIVAGVIHPLRRSCVIGRWHIGCPSNECMSRGFWDPPDIPVSDSHCYISRHHVRVQLDSRNGCWIKDLQSLNGTTVFQAKQSGRRTTSRSMERLVPGVWYPLYDGALVALGYHQHKGPYFVVSYHSSSVTHK